jgi:hypothetical protein
VSVLCAFLNLGLFFLDLLRLLDDLVPSVQLRQLTLLIICCKRILRVVLDRHDFCVAALKVAVYAVLRLALILHAL